MFEWTEKSSEVCNYRLNLYSAFKSETLQQEKYFDVSIDDKLLITIIAYTQGRCETFYYCLNKLKIHMKFAVVDWICILFSNVKLYKYYIFDVSIGDKWLKLW